MGQLSLIEQLEFAVARLETEDMNGKHFFSTGFFYEVVSRSNPGKRQVFIVTNKHSILGMNKITFCLSQGDEFNSSPKYAAPLKHETPISLLPVVYHPDEQVDLCAIPITIFLNVRSQMKSSLFYRTFGEDLLPSDSQVDSFDALEDILMVGYPNGLWDEKHNLPVFRRGITATPIAVNYNDRKEFLIDAACYKGSSGSPILICDIGHVRDKFGGMSIGTSRVYLLGVLYKAPVVTMEGEIVMENRPELQTAAKAKTQTPINIGVVANYQALRELTEEIRTKFSIL